MAESEEDSGCGCLIIIILFIIIAGLCDRVTNLENDVKQRTQADTGYYQTESQTYQQSRDSLCISK